MLTKRILNFYLEIAIFKHVFESCRHWPNLLHILVCYSVTSRWNLDYHTPMSRGHPGLSYGPNSLNISGVIRELELGETFGWKRPRSHKSLDSILILYPGLARKVKLVQMSKSEVYRVENGVLTELTLMERVKNAPSTYYPNDHFHNGLPQHIVRPSTNSTFICWS